MNFESLKKLAHNAKERVVDSTKKGYNYGNEKGRQGHDAAKDAANQASIAFARRNVEDSRRHGEGQVIVGADTDIDNKTQLESSGSTSSSGDNGNNNRGDSDSSNSTSFPSLKTVAETSGGVFGAIGGALLGVARAGYGIPKDIARAREREAQHRGFQEKWGPRELGRIHARSVENAVVRIVCLRHGHGFHNDAFGVSSLGNRDAALSELGREQCAALGRALSLLAPSWDLIVVSPFRRTLETAALVLGDAASRQRCPTIVQPLCAEHCGGAFEGNLDELNRWRAMVARGDLGSPPEKLREAFDSASFPQYQDSLSRLPEKWWCHGRKDGFETRESFLQRARDLRLWLVAQAPELRVRQRASNPEIPKDVLPRILLVSHGGILSSCFEFDKDPVLVAQAQRARGKMQNCEMRVYDVCADGTFGRPIGAEEEGLVSGLSGGGAGAAVRVEK